MRHADGFPYVLSSHTNVLLATAAISSLRYVMSPLMEPKSPISCSPPTTLRLLSWGVLHVESQRNSMGVKRKPISRIPQTLSLSTVLPYKLEVWTSIGDFRTNEMSSRADKALPFTELLAIRLSAKPASREFELAYAITPRPS